MIKFTDILALIVAVGFFPMLILTSVLICLYIDILLGIMFTCLMTVIAIVLLEK